MSFLKTDTNKSTGVSCFIGLATLLPFIPLNHFAGKVVVAAQDNLMKARDERISLMNEVLGAIRMVKVKSSSLYNLSLFIMAVD